MLNRSISIMCAVFAVFMFSLRIAAQQLNEEDRNRYVTQIRAYKHDYIVKELDLTKEQQNAFFELYDNMEDKIMDLGTEVRNLENSALSDNASSEEVSAAVAALYSQKQQEGEIEMEYYEKYKNILSPRQLVLLKQAERKFNQQLMRQHRRIRGEKMNARDNKR